ncbi:MAG: hypothetical protein HKN85_07380 [Gammaproteobacteria bacterium]|nr:hypothetical protein [Gammaproteobacteria bacterium]
MNEYQLKLATQTQLRDTRNSLTELEYLLAVEKLPAKDQRVAALNLSNVHLAYQKILTTELKDLRTGLSANEADLLAGIKSVNKALKKLKNAKNIINTVSAFLKVVGRVVKLF